MKTTNQRVNVPTQVFASYQDRESKYLFIESHFKKYLKDATSVLDIGCDDNKLKSRWGSKVLGIDIGGNPDQIVNLEQEKLSRFDNASFDLLVCIDLLEHIDNLHAVLDDMIRVSKSRIIISLPNCGHFFRIMPVVFGISTGKYYGLPVDPPKDRHKWYFTWRELHHFFKVYAKRNNLLIESEFLSYGYRSVIRRVLLKIVSFVLPITTFSQGYWIVLKKPQ